MDNQSSAYEIDIKELAGLLIRNIWLIALLSLVVGSFAFMYSKKCIPVKYTSSILVYVMNNQLIQNSGEILLSDINASQKLVETYSVILKDDVVMKEVGEKLIKKYGEDYIGQIFPVEYDSAGISYIDAKYINGVVSMGAVNETEVLKISATTTSPEVSADICTYVTDIAPSILSRVIGAAYVEPIGYADVPKQKSSPNNGKNGMVGAFIGLVLGVIIVVIKKIMNNTVAKAEDIEQKFGLPVLGEIPYYEKTVEVSKNV